MIRFSEKNFSEYDAMRSLYVELMKNARGNKDRYTIIDSSALIPVLRGNNVVIERFVISTSFLHSDRYRMYLKVGAKAKMPDEVRLPSMSRREVLGNMDFELNGSMWEDGTTNGDSYVKDFKKDKGNTYIPPNASPFKKQQRNESYYDEDEEIKLFAGDDKYHPDVKAVFKPNIPLAMEVKEILGDAIKYDKKERSLVLEFKSIQDAVRALDILPFGIDYKIFLLNL